MDERRTAPQTIAAARAGISVATARRIERDPRPPSERREPRHWRTREDPLALVWDSFIVPLLQRAPGLKPVTVLHELDHAFPGAYGERIRRTLERRMRDWRAVHGPEATTHPHRGGRLHFGMACSVTSARRPRGVVAQEEAMGMSGCSA